MLLILDFPLVRKVYISNKNLEASAKTFFLFELLDQVGTAPENMFEFREKVLFEYWSFVDEPWTSVSLDFKFPDGYIIDHEDVLKVLVKDVELVGGDGEIIKSDMLPIWRNDRPFRLTFEFDAGLGVMLPRNAKVCGKVAQNVPDLIGIERTSISISKSPQSLVKPA